MALVNIHFLNLQNNYLFADIAKKVNAFKVMHPKADVISLGIGDVTQPLCPAVSLYSNSFCLGMSYFMAIDESVIPG